MFTNPKLTNLGDLLRRNALRYPDREAVVSATARLTWAELNRRSNRLAHKLLNMEIKKGDRVAVILNNTHQVIEVMFAAFKIGAVYVPLNYRLSPEEISIIINDCGAVVIFYAQDFAATVQAIKSESTQVKYYVVIGQSLHGDPAYEEWLSNVSEQEPESFVGLDNLAIIPYTGGTTGLPKGAMYGHRNIMATIQDHIFPFELAFKSRQLNAAPIFAGGCCVQILNNIYCATTIILMDFDVLNILRAIEREKVELLPLSTVPLFMIANHPEAENFNVSSLKRIFYGGGSMNLRYLEKIQKFFGCELVQQYGSTETLINITTLGPYDHLLEGDEEKTIRLTSAGRANRGVDIRLVDDKGKDVPLGEVGEIVIRSHSNVVGYWNMPELNRESFQNGWYYSKDMAYFDEEGYLFIVDRKNDMIKTGGMSVYPAEVEEVLENHPDIAEAAVVSAPDPIWGERVVAVIVLREGTELSAEEVIGFCRTKLGGYKVPKQVDFLDTPLPRNPLGKVLRKDIREIYWKGCGKKRVL